MQKERKIWRTIVLAISLTVLILLIRDFNSRMADLRRLTADLERVSAQATQLSVTKQYLETRVAFAESDEAVRRYAYEEGRLQQPDDVVVVLVPESGPLPTSTPALQTPAPPVEKWQLWIALFVDLPKQTPNSP